MTVTVSKDEFTIDGASILKALKSRSLIIEEHFIPEGDRGHSLLIARKNIEPDAPPTDRGGRR
jgi:hypothetical protein